ncbi:MAG: pilus assembly protein [Desulfovibrio sp.]|jgi:type IVB pilus formation R64 PilN family outer membrane protein|nr:pilus assembly protein [Desulfovibrio sp.]
MLRHIIVVLLAVLLLLPSGCAHKDAPTSADVERQGEKLRELSRSRAVSVVDEPYIGARAVPITSSGALNMRVTLRTRGSLADIAETISDMTRIPVQVSLEAPEPIKAGAGEPPLAVPSGRSDISISYEGPLRGLLEQVSVQSGYGWDYNASTNSVLFAHLMVRTFSLHSAPGEVSYNSQLTNKSKENTSGNSIGGSGISQTVTTDSTSAQISQTNVTKLKFDVWKDTETVVKSLLSKAGSVVCNQAAGTITVRDRPGNVRQIASYIDDLNTKLERQVALNVQVWSLEVNDDAEAGLDLQALFRNSDVSVVAGSLAAIGSLNTASATIVQGKLKDSSAVLKTLKQWGKATQVTSAGGLIMNNQKLPALAVTKLAYLAGASLNTSQYSQTSEVTPGEVTTGFSMTVIPHILDRRHLILQYNLDLSALDSMEEFKTDNIVVQLPQVSKRAFSQRTRMRQTLVLAGFAQQTQSGANTAGLLSFGRKAGYGKTLLVITIEVESAANGTE